MVIIDDTYVEIKDKMRGRKPKIKLKKDGKQYIFKYGSINYEIWSELIAEQLGKQCKIDMAHYEVAEYKGRYGVLTPVFLNDGELSISSDYLRKSVSFIFEENNIDGSLEGNTILNIIQSLYTFDSQIDIRSFTYELMKRWVFSMLVMESDKNETNIAFIKSKNGIRLAPDYDNSSIARLNENINGFLDSMRYTHCDIRSFTDNIKNSLLLTDDNNGLFWHDFELFARKYPIQCRKIMEAFSEINVDLAIETVEKNNQIEVPWVIKFWLEKTIMTRLEDMNNICKLVEKKIK